ncbi:RNA polymerase sigma-H factor [Caloramator mitchellensis]|uniref:RNA polymerase sigma factor SigS n=1 Tax=Caloramator mitchellensis TaxID=908809 RepID=A0A0R3JSH4_CALMK|nr:RNA polymerase sigma-H factor [Caloramator mitchellensis]
MKMLDYGYFLKYNLCNTHEKAATGGIQLQIHRGALATLAGFDSMIDEEIVAMAQEGDRCAEEYLIFKYMNYVKAKAKAYFLIGADKEDIFQEGMIGLYKAIRDFKNDKLSSFRAFAELCITRQIITAIKTATRQKHIPLNCYISLNKPVFEDESERTLIDVISSLHISDPEELIISKEERKKIEKRMLETLSDLEIEVLRCYLDGKTYQEIACDLDRHAKSIDNALQRIKRKLEKLLNEKD